MLLRDAVLMTSRYMLGSIAALATSGSLAYKYTIALLMSREAHRVVTISRLCTSVKASAESVTHLSKLERLCQSLS